MGRVLKVVFVFFVLTLAAFGAHAGLQQARSVEGVVGDYARRSCAMCHRAS